jgi:hypothetical protein
MVSGVITPAIRMDMYVGGLSSRETLMTAPSVRRDVMNDPLIEKIVLGEIEGKNRAIHAYGDIVWKIRTGLLTLLDG